MVSWHIARSIETGGHASKLKSAYFTAPMAFGIIVSCHRIVGLFEFIFGFEFL